MRFEFYHEGLSDVPKLSVDGTVANSFHFSHWQGNETPAEVKADTSTEIVLNTVASPRYGELTGGIDLVVNNHFDTDGVLSVWSMLTGGPALEWRERLIGAAEAGDFSEYPDETAVKVSLTIQGSDSPVPGEPPGSPLANHFAGSGGADDARAYELVLPVVEDVLADVGQFEALWRSPWDRIARALESFARGSSRVQEDAEGAVSVITLAPEVFSPSGFKPTRHSAPFTAISHQARGRFFVIATPVASGWSYRLDYPYYSWAETVVRPRIVRRVLTALCATLNESERNLDGQWCVDDSGFTTAGKFAGTDGMLAVSTLDPEAVGSAVRAAFSDSAAMATGK